MKRFVARFRAAGGVVVTGTDGRPFYAGGIHDELRLLVEAGLTPAAALRAATFDAARVLRWQNRVGSVAPGRFADLLILDANPLEDIRNAARINAIVLGGRFIDSVERNRLLAGLAAR
jgi:imidazolonepropionase-like amidohydrolase